MLRGTEIRPGQPLPVAGGERCELGDGLSGTAFLVDWQGDGGRDLLYSLLPNIARWRRLPVPRAPRRPCRGAAVRPT